MLLNEIQMILQKHTHNVLISISPWEGESPTVPLLSSLSLEYLVFRLRYLQNTKRRVSVIQTQRAATRIRKPLIRGLARKSSRS